MPALDEIDLVLPVFDPPSNWVRQTLKRRTTLESAAGVKVNLIVVNDGSGTTELFHELQKATEAVTVIHLERNRGKGAALRAGMKKATSQIIVFTDADFPYTIESMVSVIDSLRGGADIALGYRENDYYASVPWFRKGMSELFRFLLKEVLRFPITDTQCGLKGMNQKGREVFLKTSIDRFLVDMEFIKRAVRQQQLKITPVVVQLRKDVIFSKMGMGVILREGVNFVKIIFS